MPGICAIVSSSAPADHAARLDAMCGRMRHCDWYREERRVDAASGLAMARLSLGFVNPADQPATSDDGSLVAVMHGELYEADRLRRGFERAGRRIRSGSHAELLLCGYETEGKQFFARLHGSFAAAIWNRTERRLILTNDRFGMQPLYFARAAGRFVVASEIKALFADSDVSREPSLRGLSQFFTFGHFLGEDTLFDAVRMLPAAAWFTFDANEDRLTPDRYWHLESRQVETDGSTPELLDRLTATFQAAVDRRVAGDARLGISLSGGLDSRTILAAIDTEKIPITSVSMGMVGSLDHRCAERMAELAGARHHSCVLDGRVLARFEEHLKRTVHVTDGQLLSQGIMQYTLPVYRDLGVEVLLRGHAGELLHMDKAYSFSLDAEAFAARTESQLEDWLMRRMSDFMVGNVTEPLFDARLGANARGLARESLREALAESAGMEPLVQRVSHLFVTQRMRRETAASMQEFGSLVETRLPFLDNDFIDLLFAMPPELKLGDGLQQHMLRKLFPRFLDVTNANTGTRIGARRLVRRLATFRLKALGRLGVPGYQPYERLGLWLRRELRPLVEAILLGERFRDRGVFQPEAVRSIVERHFAKQANHTYVILAMLVFEFAQREFVDGEVPDVSSSHDAVAPERVAS